MSQAMYAVLVLFLLMGCGKKDSSSSGKMTAPLNPEEMEEILDKQEFACRVSPSSCPYGIGRLFILNPKDFNTSSLCTGFLVSGTKMVTNHHCVGSDDECRNTYVSVRTRSGPARARCKNIIYTRSDARDPDERAIDFTVFELDRKISTDYFRVSSRKAKKGDHLIAWVVDQLSLTEAIVTRLDCLYETKDFSMIMRNCPAIAGNSGSPMMGESGEIVSILWGSSLPPTVTASFPFDLRLSLAGISAATELFPYRSILSDADSSLR